MMFAILYLVGAASFGILMTIIYIKKYRNTPIDVWKPKIAWTRALIYFSFCNVIIAASGTLTEIFSQPIFTIEQISNPFWITYCVISYVYIFIAYWVLWSRMTLTFNRKFYIGSELFFGFIWGFSTGGLFLSIYNLWRLTNLPNWVIYLLCIICIGLWQYFIHDYFWDVYVSPEHDTPKSIIVKTLVCHIPNVLICFGFLVIWNNYVIFISFQTLALIASIIFQKFPAPWAQQQFHAPMVKPGIFGLPHGSGYLGEEKTTEN